MHFFCFECLNEYLRAHLKHAAASTTFVPSMRTLRSSSLAFLLYMMARGMKALIGGWASIKFLSNNSG